MAMNITRLLFMLILLSSCSPVARTVLGIKAERTESESYQKEYLASLGIDTNYMAVIEPSRFTDLGKDPYQLDTFTNQSFTPIQFRVYDKEGNFHTGWEQCFGSARKMKIYENFPQKAKDYLPLNRAVHLASDLELINPLNFDKSEVNKVLKEKYDYVVIAVWAGYLGTLSKSMMKDLDLAIKNSDKKILFVKANLGKPAS
jgi:hypothetical protein